MCGGGKYGTHQVGLEVSFSSCSVAPPGGVQENLCGAWDWNWVGQMNDAVSCSALYLWSIFAYFDVVSIFCSVRKHMDYSKLANFI